MNKPLLLFFLLCCGVPCHAADMEITPFRTTNQSPLIQIHGLPAESSAAVAPHNRFIFSLTQDIANNYTNSVTPRERILLDGESYRWTLAARYGIGRAFEAGIEIPYVLYGGGFLDSFIVDWHRTFNLPQGGRDSAPRDRLNFSYEKDGRTRLGMKRAGSGVGDIALTSAMVLHDRRDEGSLDRVALRGSLKLPIGESGSLRGSGSTDFALSLCGEMDNFTEWGSLGVYGSLGGMAMSDGDVLRDQQENLVGFGTFGVGWGPAEWISFKVQVNGHTPFYRGSSLDELSAPSFLLLTGGALRLPGNYLLDLAVSEDVAVATSPDVVFHLGLSRRF